MKRTIVQLVLLLLALSCVREEVQTERLGLGLEPSIHTFLWKVGGDGGAGISRGSDENRAYGPQSIACLSDGRLGILDNMNGRLVEFAADGSIVGETGASPMTVDVVGLIDGYAALELARNLITIQRDDGSVEEKTLPVGLAPVQSLALDVEGRPLIRTAYQEEVVVSDGGIARGTQGLRAFDGNRYQVVAAVDGAKVRLGGRWRFDRVHCPQIAGDGCSTENLGLLPFSAAAVRFMDTMDGGLVFLADHLSEDRGVERKIHILDAELEILMTVDLEGGLYTPNQQVRVCQDGTLVWFIPGEDGLVIGRLERERGSE